MGAIDPTPTVGMVGIIEEESWITRQFFRDCNDAIFLLGPIGHEIGATHFLKEIHGRKEGLPPRLDFELELAVESVVSQAIQKGLIKSAHDCSEGGLAVALAESCISGETPVGATICFPRTAGRTDLVLFNETQSRVIVSVGHKNIAEFEQLCETSGILFSQIGKVGGTELAIEVGNETTHWSVDELYDLWYYSIRRAMASH